MPAMGISYCCSLELPGEIADSRPGKGHGKAGASYRTGEQGSVKKWLEYVPIAKSSN